MGQARSINGLARQAKGCRACPLWENATQTVFGEGPREARIMLVGEQPGDREDVEGRPFVGPAGRMLDRALESVGLDRDTVYVTNTVKHFKNVERGKRRIHQSPKVTEIEICVNEWFGDELRLVQPAVIVCLGATAAKALIRKNFRVTVERGEFFPFDDSTDITATWHPSYFLRQRDKPRVKREFALFTADIAAAVARADAAA